MPIGDPRDDLRLHLRGRAPSRRQDAGPPAPNVFLPLVFEPGVERASGTIGVFPEGLRHVVASVVIPQCAFL